MTYIEAGYGNHFRFDVRKWKDLKSGFTHLADGDVAFAKITPCFQNRKSMILDDLPNGIAGGTTELNVLRVFGKTLNREYLLYFIKSHYFIGEAIFKGTAGQQRVRTGYTENKLIPIPPFSEQERIVGKINNVLPVVEKYELSQNHLDRLNSLIRERLKKSILQEAIQGKLAHQDSQEGDASELLSRIFEEKRKMLKEGKLKRKDLVESLIYKGEDNKYYEKVDGKVLDINEEIPFDIPESWSWKVDGKVLDINEEIPFDIPESWSWVRLQQICTYIHRGKSPKYSEVKKFPVVAQKCNQWDGFHIEKAQFIAPESVSSYADENLLQDKDLLWNSTGLGTLGRIGLYPESSNPYGFAVADSHVTVIRTLPKFIRPEYLLLYFSSPTVQSVIEDKASGSTKQKELATETVKSYIVPIPPLAEQDRILDKYKTVLASWS